MWVPVHVQGGLGLQQMHQDLVPGVLSDQHVQYLGTQGCKEGWGQVTEGVGGWTGMWLRGHDGWAVTAPGWVSAQITATDFQPQSVPSVRSSSPYLPQHATPDTPRHVALNPSCSPPPRALHAALHTAHLVLLVGEV